MKKVSRILLILCLTLGLSACNINNTNDDDINDYKIGEEIDLVKLGEDYVAALLEGNYEEAYDNYPHDEAMKKAMNANLYAETMVAIKDQIGDVVSLSPSYKYEFKQYIIVSIPIEGSKSNININVVFDSNSEIAGFNLSEFKVSDQEEVKTVENYVEKEMVLSSDGYELNGTLTLPSKGDNFPVIIIVSGSGPMDKDGTVGPNKVYKDLSQQLASKGVATFRYDKRTYAYGEEIIDEYNFDINDEYIVDIVSAYNLVRNIPEIDSDNINILGHSLGGHLIPMINEVLQANRYIIMAGNVTHIEHLITVQYEYLFNLDGEISDEEQQYINKHYEDLIKLSNLDSLDEKEIVIGGYKAYWESLASYSPIESGEDIEVPVLVLQGERDYQVNVDEYNQWLEAFDSKDNWSFKKYQGLNHLMIKGEGVPSPNEYFNVGAVDEQVIKDIVEWIDDE